jgi:alkylation response protein AidB-like acyl-CoA dehydrogenase
MTANDAGARFEARLGDPRAAANPISFASGLEADEAEAFPSAAAGTLHRIGYLEHLVPARDGGRLESLSHLIEVGRVVARRDLTIAIATGQTLLASIPVWLDGDAAQRSAIASLVRSGGAGSLALTEETHGSDLAASEVDATATGDDWSLSGTKWCINNATRGAFLSVLARSTSSAHPAGGQSLFLVRKAALAAGGATHLPRLRTHGIRGADISGIRFDGAKLGGDALVGREGRGLDLTLRTLQVSRLACAAFSLGAGDTVIRTAFDFASQRALYGKPAIAIPVVRETLANALADLLAIETLALVAARAAALVPGELSVVSAIVKATAPAWIDGAIRDAIGVLGARGYLREGETAIAQKMARDHAVVGLFDGSTAVNLSVLAHQIPRNARARAEQPNASAPNALALFSLGEAAPSFDWAGLKLTARGADTLVGSVRTLVRATGSGPIATHATQLERELTALDRDLLARADATDAVDDEASFALTRLYCALAVAAAALGVWVAARDALPAELGEAAWAGVIARALDRVSPCKPAPESTAALVEALASWTASNRALSLTPIALGGARPVNPA